MKTLLHHLAFFSLQISLLVMFCYLSHVVAIHTNCKCIDHEREALLRFKHNIEDDQCGILSSWGEQEDCCQWSGIRCSNLTGHVTMLDLQGHQDSDDAYCSLGGELDNSLFELKHLKYLDLSGNGFYQFIPDSIGSLTNLEHLNLSLAGFSGEIPPQLGNLSKLESLDLNYYSDLDLGLFAKSLQWLSRLTMLREIHLSGSNLSEATDMFHAINKLPSLKVLYLDQCELPPIVPSSLSYINASISFRVVSIFSSSYKDTSIFQWLFNLSKHGNQFEYLGLSYNEFVGPIPSAFEDMHSLSYLDLSWNNFTGPIPSVFGDLRSLSYLDLSWNKLEGPIPYNFSNLKSLRYFSISNNKFDGIFPKLLGKLCNLQELYLDYNSFAGDLFNVIQTLSSGCANMSILKTLSLTGNQFWGSVPDISDTFSLVRELNLGGNKLNGTISQGIGHLTMLEKLDVSNCSLNVTLNHNHFFNLSKLSVLKLSDNPKVIINISAQWIPPFQLDIVSLRSCNMGAAFPNWILTQKNVFYVDISDSQISDFPSTIWTKLASKIKYLNVSHNKIHGVLPNSSTTFNSLSVIDFSSNYLEGSILSFLSVNTIKFIYLGNNKFSDASHLLCPKTELGLRVLDLSNNLLSGELPECWMKFDELGSLHLENNNFSGNIPTSLGSLDQLYFLYLENNSFSGQLPASLENCTSLYALYLGYNSLTGNIPSYIGNAFPELRVLNLRKNKMFGSLPSSFCQLSNLHMLDLAMNRISGVIPKCIYNLTGMTDTHQLDNVLKIIPLEVGQEFIYSNEETSTIMWKREEQSFKSDTLMQLVKSIDLSRNELEGNIPDGISQLKGLINLDLSRNNLNGGIPSNIGQLTSLDLLDLSNNHLSGGIPISLADVNSLGTLDLSNNNLSGKIPLGTQLQSFDSSSYMGNPLLCGAPLDDCAGDEPPTKANNGENIIPENDHGNGDFYVGLYISVVLGFIIGFWGVCGTLVVKSSWRHAFFRYFDDMKDKIYVMVVVNVSKVWKKP